MNTLAIIGSAGRRDDRMRWKRNTYAAMLNSAEDYIQNNDITHLVSGGAALSDHVAVALFLQNPKLKLTLHLPAEFRNSKFLGTDWNSPGKVSNHYHDLFSRKTGISSLRQIQRAIDLGATVHIYGGFKTRNLEVGKVEHLLAFTYGTADSVCRPGDPGYADARIAGLKTGGTSHTWNYSKASLKTHFNLSNFP